MKQENDFVRTTLLSWINLLVKQYNVDGLRIDTVPEVPKWFWKQFADSAGIFQIGEVFDGRTDYVADYQRCCLDSVLNYPLWFALKDVFVNNQSMKRIESAFIENQKNFVDTSVLGTFINNHDNARFLNRNENIKKFENAITFVMLAGKMIFFKNI